MGRSFTWSPACATTVGLDTRRQGLSTSPCACSCPGPRSDGPTEVYRRQIIRSASASMMMLSIVPATTAGALKQSYLIRQGYPPFELKVTAQDRRREIQKFWLYN